MSDISSKARSSKNRRFSVLYCSTNVTDRQTDRIIAVSTYCAEAHQIETVSNGIDMANLGCLRPLRFDDLTTLRA